MQAKLDNLEVRSIRAIIQSSVTSRRSRYMGELFNSFLFHQTLCFHFVFGVSALFSAWARRSFSSNKLHFIYQFDRLEEFPRCDYFMFFFWFLFMRSCFLLLDSAPVSIFLHWYGYLGVGFGLWASFFFVLLKLRQNDLAVHLEKKVYRVSAFQRFYY